MTPSADDRDDKLADLFGAAGGDGPAPDPDFLARLRERSTDAFLAAGEPPVTPAPNRRSAMMSVLVRLSAAAVAAAALVVAVLHFWPADSDASLARVLDRTADADTLHLRVTRAGQTGDVWVGHPNNLRWEESADRYLIAHGQNVYRVDEVANRVTPGIAAYFRPDRPGVNVFALLDVPTPKPEALREARPERGERDGRPVDVYRVEVADRDGTPLTVEAEAEPATGKLRAVQALAVRGGGVPQVIAALVVLAEGQPVPEEKFAVKNTLSEDGRVGKVVDVQGVVSVKPVGRQRWTPVRPNLLVMPGDWVRADVRGANAATLRLMPQAAVIVGPGGLVEVTRPTKIRLHEGEAEVAPAKGTPIELLGPGDQKEVVTARGFYRVQNEQLTKVEKQPLWLKGFKGATAEESIGSLVAKVDGRNVPLSVGYHKVSVEIRDQIARTTVEESFVNHTDGQLEGQFHFPLPQDASISGFAMWIGDQMVEADVVEKQRAREIYEQIMREKRDPGLLEWTGGNIFKARVWPIFPNSEKRIRITYTQVLPRVGDKYRYSYALQSEMLQQHPLRELSIDVRVSSAAPLKAVTSPTHTVRTEKTDHAAHLEFAAQEYTPARDFEAVVEVADQAPEVAVVPHRRGEDGYFLVQITPPAEKAADRDLVADTGPLHLTLVCDTSASMDPGQRANQNAVAAALLEALTPADTFNLAACDVAADWAFDKPQPATPANVQKARTFLAGRVSLGWTDLDRAFDAALKQCGPHGQVVYLGDGIVTTGDANPQAFADRLRAMYKASGTNATLHAVALGSAFEPVVLKTIGSLGGGSVRRVTNEQGPVPVALELLGEMTRPPVRDLKVDFKGWKVAQVYPEVLPNLVPGTQQILIGRYLPEGKDQTGEVVVTGRRGDREVRYSAKATLADAEAGNSFLPRLWARMHLDKLLEQPQTDAVKDDVIALSEEYGIITPYTSLLVLESDADRERFKVKKRFRMRDGEKFFADGRGKADFDLAREQMKRAGDWRVGLRRNVLALLSGLGRDVGGLLPQDQYSRGDYARRAGRAKKPMGGSGGGMGNEGLEYEYAESFGVALDKDKKLFEGGWAEAPDFEFFSRTEKEKAAEAKPVAPVAAEPGEPGQLSDLMDDVQKKAGEWDEDEKRENMPFDGTVRDLGLSVHSDAGLNGAPFGSRGLDRLDMAILDRSALLGRPASGPVSATRYLMDKRRKARELSYAPAQWFAPLFPPLAAPAKPAAAPKSDWPQEARDLARSLLRRDALAKLPGGLVIERRTESFDPKDGAVTGTARRLELYSPTAWAARTEGEAAQTLLDWCDGKDRGVFGTAFRLGRTRAAVPADLRDPPLQVNDHSLTPLDETYRHMTASVEKAGGKTVLVLKQVSANYEMRFTIDPEKRVVTKVEQFQNGKPTAATTYSDFAEAGRSWWARTSESTDDHGRRTARTTQTVSALDAGPFADRVKQLLAGRDGVAFLRMPGPSVADAKKALAAGKAGFDDRFTLLSYYTDYQQWSRAGDQLAALEKLAADRPGVRWLRTVFFQASRRGEELRQRLLADADTIARMPAGGDRVALADYVMNLAQSALAANEQVELLERFRPAFADLPKQSQPRKRWRQYRIYALQNAGRGDEALALQKAAATDSPTDYGAQLQYAQALFSRGDREAALAWLDRQFAPGAGWSAGEEESIRGQYAGWLEDAGRFPELVEYLGKWVKRNPESEDPYSRYLSALVRSGEEKKADDLIAAWLKDAQVKGDIAPAVQARFRAATATATGRGHNLSSNTMDPRWVKPLADAARFFADDPKNYGLIEPIVGAWQFHQTDEAGRVRADLFDRVARRVGDMPAPWLCRLLVETLSGPPEVDRAVWVKLGDGLRDRWQKETDPSRRDQLGALLARVLSTYVGADEHLAFLARQLKEGPEPYRAQYAGTLFDTLLAAPWNEQREGELLALLPKLGDPDQPDARTVAQVMALYRFTDSMTQARNQALRKGIDHPEKLTRTELAKKYAELLNKARTDLAGHLKQAEATLPEDLRPWAAAERLYLLARADADPKPLAAECWKFLGDAPKARPQEDEPTARRQLADALPDRYLAMALYFASRRGAAPELVDRTLKYLDAGIAAEPAEPGWKAAKFQLLVALDRPKDLEAALAAWVKAGDADGRWRTALGYLLAELGRLNEAIALFERVEKTDELGYAGYRTLAGWYMAVNKRGAHEAALVNSFKAVDENTLSRLLYAKLSPWQRGGGHLPTELDQDVLRVFAALFEKSSYPQNYLWQLQQFYQACRDFRLLGVMADAVVGQTANKIYPFLQGMQGVLNEVRDEATADELLARIEKLQSTAKTPTDLQLCFILPKRRAAEVQNQPGPHAERALAAMKRAFDRPWADGEPLLMSNLLRDLGSISRKDLADEQLRELRELHARTKPGTFERLQTAHNLGTGLGYYGRHKEGVELLQKSLDEYAAAHAGVLPSEADGAIQTLVSFHETLDQYAKAEQLLRGLMKKPANAEQEKWLALRLDELYHLALSVDKTVSLGSGAKLYRALENRLVGEAETPDPNHRYQLVSLLCQVYRTAKQKNVPGADGDLKAFAHESLPALLKTQSTNYETVVNQVAQVVRELLGPQEGVAFLVDRIEQEPGWFRLNNQDGWARHGWALAQWRAEAKVLPFELDKRLLKLVLAELRRDLRTRQPRNRIMYVAFTSYYWVEKEEDFARVADEVYAERKDSGPAVEYVAEYLYRGCNRPARAIDVLFEAHAKKLLDDGGQVQLVRYLHEQNRHGESVAILLPLVERSPDVLQYRTLLCTAYDRTGQRDKLVATFDAAEKHFRHKDRWTEGAMAELARSAVECKLYERAVAICGELIPLHQRTQPNRGVGNGTLSGYYQLLAQAQSGLGHPMEAIDAAGGAIVSWGPNARGRAEALNSLRSVIAAAPSLDQVAQKLDDQTAESGLVNPVVRKAVGQVYHDKGQYQPAVVQLQIALSAQPNDAEALKLLIDCFDKMKNAEGAAAQVLRALELSRRDIQRYEELGRRYEALGRAAEAERAYTSVVEVLPNESEGHQLLAEVRQRQDRWAEAIREWEQVARIRSLEPTGLLGLAAAQLHERKLDKAAETLGKLKARPWPQHFADAPHRIAELERQLREAQKR